ncbi:uncharacterized protein LOC110266836 [Arachis ipaensis]|uniref:uncharacterized protein LOC110266836 n=1 Tax=Arachis ipaensis TaxID=130454 RepID=UPI000A2B13C3|nr:uncharacterized protein LOC110266836 [Arachis ipaensis]XP_025678440.1 uncharacterized protein LOC112778325 [Arachis hypogaea]
MFSSSFSPEPHSSFYLALVVHNRIVLLLGDSPKDAYSKSKALHANNPNSLLLKKEHVFADTVYSTTAIFGGKTRRIQIDCGSSKDNDSASSKLSFSVDGDRVLQIKRLKWKFRGNERVESMEGAPELLPKEKDSEGGEGGNEQGQQGKASKGEERASESPCETESQRSVMKSSDKPPMG